MKKYTVDDIMALEPCEEYPRGRVEDLIGEGKTLYEMTYLYISVEDIIWAISLLLGRDPRNSEFARWCARQVIHLWDCPNIVLHCLRTGEGASRCEEYFRSKPPNYAERSKHEAAWSARHATWTTSGNAVPVYYAAISACIALLDDGEEMGQKQLEKLRELVA